MTYRGLQMGFIETIDAPENADLLGWTMFGKMINWGERHIGVCKGDSVVAASNIVGLERQFIQGVNGKPDYKKGIH